MSGVFRAAFVLVALAVFMAASTLCGSARATAFSDTDAPTGHFGDSLAEGLAPELAQTGSIPAFPSPLESEEDPSESDSDDEAATRWVAHTSSGYRPRKIASPATGRAGPHGVARSLLKPPRRI